MAIGTRGIQDPQGFDLVDRLMTQIANLEAEVMELRALHRNEASFIVKITPDDEPVIAETPAFIYAIPFDVDGLYLEDVEAFVTTVGGSATTIRLRNIKLASTVTVTLANLTIDSGQKHSNPTYILDNTKRQFMWKDQLAIDVLSAGGGAKGLGVILKFL